MQRRCAYALAVRGAVEHACEANAYLFLPRELEVLKGFLGLPDSAASVCARLLQRKSIWLKPSAVRRYIARNIGDSTEDVEDRIDLDLTASIASLSAGGFVEMLAEDSPFETAWQVMDSVCRVDELQELWRMLCGAKPKGLKSSRDELLSAMRRHLMSQRTCFGSLLLSTFAKKLCAFLAASGSGSGQPFRLREEAAMLLRRVQRLHQVTSSLPSGGDLISVYEAVEFCAPLMVTFKLVSYTDYPLCARGLRAIFPDAASFRSWEAATELKFLMEKVLHCHSEHWQTIGETGEQARVARALRSILPVLDGLGQAFCTALLLPTTPLGAWIEQRLQRQAAVSSGDLLAIALLFLLAMHVPAPASAAPLASYMVRMHTGSVLAYATCELVSALEKSGLHLAAVHVLLVLLRLPYLPHRRGMWYIRLCVDCDHLCLRGLAVATAAAGLADPLVQMSDEIDLRERALNPPNRKAQPGPLALELESQVALLQGLPQAEQLSFLAAMVLQDLEGLWRPAPTVRVDLTAAIRSVTARQWSCERCTFANRDTRTGARCEICGESAPTYATEEVQFVATTYSGGELQVVDLISDDESEPSTLPAEGFHGILARLAYLTATTTTVPAPAPVAAESACLARREGDDILSHCRALLEGGSRGLQNLGLRSFWVRGRRFGDRQRKGKSRFCGRNGELMTVEELAMEKCWRLDPDDCGAAAMDEAKLRPAGRPAAEAWQDVDYEHALSGGGWRGWHCEGLIVRTLCGLLMWEIFFSPPPPPLQAQGLDPAAALPVFVTPYQDAPLDFPYPEFYQRRKAAIDARLEIIRDMSPVGVIAEVARQFRAHRGQRCALVAWDAFPLAGLQVAAAAMGGWALAAFCLAFARSFKQFSSGGPDLFFVRAIRASPPGLPGQEETVDLDEVLGGDAWRRGRASPAQWGSADWDTLRPRLPPSLTPRKRPARPADGAADPTAQPLRSKLLRMGGSDAADAEDEGEGEDEGENLGDEGQGEDKGENLSENESEDGGRDVGMLLEGLRLEAMLVEVKGPTDALAHKQVLWLRLLALLGPSVQGYVCHVKET